MTSPAFDIEAIRERLQRGFVPAAAGDQDHVYQYRVGTAALFHLHVRAGQLEVAAGHHPDPAVTFYVDSVATALGILEGTEDAMAAFMDGRIRTDGHLILALQLGALFRRPELTASAPT